jgi:Flp pilus assembly protein TadD
MFLNVLLHELGHAVPMLLLSKGVVTIYIGSLGDATKSSRIKLGRLVLYCTTNPLKWNHGLCIPPEERFSVGAQLVFTIMGPLVSVAIMIACWHLPFTSDQDDEPFFITCLLIFSFGATLLTLVPRGNVGRTAQGVPYGNDGYHIISLLGKLRTPQAILEIEQDVASKEFQRAADGVDQLLAQKETSRSLYRHGIYAHIQLKNYTRGMELYEMQGMHYTPDNHDLHQLGYLYVMLNQPDQARALYLKILATSPKDAYALNGLGYILGIGGQHKEAIEHLDKAIKLYVGFAHAYNNRGFSKLHCDELEAGFQDIEHALKLDDKNAYGYRNLGIYYYRKNEWDQAEGLLEKAKGLDADMPLVDDYLEKIKQLRS